MQRDLFETCINALIPPLKETLQFSKKSFNYKALQPICAAVALKFSKSDCVAFFSSLPVMPTAGY